MEITWRGDFTSTEANELHAVCFETRVWSAEEWDWWGLCQRHSLGWVVARDGERLIGFTNVLWDGFTHAWIQDVMVSPTSGRGGVGTALVAKAQEQSKAAGCEWLHVDFEPELAPFYLGACGFTETKAVLIHL